MKCKAKKAFFAGKNDIYHRWKEVKKLNGKSKNQYYNLSFSDNIISSIWGVMGYTVLLAFTLFKTGSLAKSVFAAH